MRKIKIPPAFGLSTTPVPATLPLHSYRRAGSDCLHRPSPGPPGGSFFFIPGKFSSKKSRFQNSGGHSALNLASVPLFKRRHRLPLVCLVHEYGIFLPEISSILTGSLPQSPEANARDLTKSASTTEHRHLRGGGGWRGLEREDHRS